MCDSTHPHLLDIGSFSTFRVGSLHNVNSPTNSTTIDLQVCLALNVHAHSVLLCVDLNGKGIKPARFAVAPFRSNSTSGIVCLAFFFDLLYSLLTLILCCRVPWKVWRK